MAIKKISFIGLLLLSNILLLSAQVDSKYFGGAVPLVDGKVQFSREVKVNSAVSKDQLYSLAKQWVDQEFSEKEGSKQRVLLADKSEGYIVAQGDEKLVFKSQIFMLDQTDFTYQIIARIEKGKCTLEVRNIRYGYQDYDKLMPAEEMIIDEVALHKSGEKLNRHYDKFRTFTIDRIDELKVSLVAYLGQVSVEEIKVKEKRPVSIVDVENNELPQPAPSIKVEGSPAVSIAQPMPVLSSDNTPQSTPMIPLTPAVQSDAMVGYKQMDADQISESIVKMFKDSRALVAVGKDNNVQVLTGAWSGTGNFGGKPVAMTFVNTESDSNTEPIYTISFYTEIHGAALDRMAESNVSERTKVAGLTPIVTPSGAAAFGEAWMIIECKKQTEQDSSESALDQNAQSKKWKNNKNTKLFMGEILNVWAR